MARHKLAQVIENNGRRGFRATGRVGMLLVTGKLSEIGMDAAINRALNPCS